MLGHSDARLRRGCWLSKEFNLAASRSRIPSSRILAGGIPPSLCSTTLGVVLHTGSAALKPWCMTLSIRVQRCVVCGVVIPFFVGLDVPGHQTSAP